MSCSEKYEVPIWHKPTLTLEEASAYSGIGVNKLRTLCDNPKNKFVVWNGTKRMIKREAFETYLNSAYSF
ncbi:MAG: helix-turn-helix domain-containing protein [Oscillospiraceae bacterium]|nr:helix-turn-helix domain-containing protein [Oscillospiraceae bacterium]MBQ7123058.1 helix-turn-helix domain-containing protein [Oscillospiraceae bacterium]MBR3597820.1 helix-turn-helix domain-containing protein [Clostridia bacterium]